ncbi:MAG: flagellar biosynthetic protein FliO [Bauldia sp.]|nr:flagellar biosynthetic protein FliO [Bauldia sp.]
MLVPIFGEDGAIIVQYVVTAAVVFGLIVLVVWSIRRYTGGGARPPARGRLPRLAVVDTLDIDKKRQLVLVRRDNVEHLIMIGGPSDVVVEPSIVRQRVAQRPGHATTTAATAAVASPALEPEVPVGPEPPPPPASPLRAVAPPPPPPARPSPAQRVMPTRGAATDLLTPDRRRDPLAFPPRRSAFRGAAVAPAMEAAADEPVPEPEPILPPRRVGPVAASEPPPDGPVPGYAAVIDGDQDGVNAFALPRADRFDPVEANEPADDEQPAARPDTAPPESPEPAAQAAEVSDLEKEMARLLDEISSTRRD